MYMHYTLNTYRQMAVENELIKLAFCLLIEAYLPPDIVAVTKPLYGPNWDTYALRATLK